jgi:carbon-monoxide dehydrogenase medium subunit
MIPPSFAYHCPTSIHEALGLLERFGEDAKILAGGHSLLPMMKLRFSEPAQLIDLNRIAELRGIREEGGKIVIGAMTTENELIDSTVLQRKLPLLVEAATQIADPQVRNRGTIGGDIAHGDPANDHPAIAKALDATFVLQGSRGERRVRAVDFFHGIYATDITADEILAAIEITPPPEGSGYAYRKLKRKSGDWATAASAVVLRLSGGIVEHVAIGLTNVAPTAIRASRAESLLKGQPVTPALLQEVAMAVRSACEPSEDLRGDADYKRAMAGEMTKRAIELAASRCR